MNINTGILSMCDLTQLLKPGAKKLTLIDARRVMSIYEDTMRRVQLVSGLLEQTSIQVHCRCTNANFSDNDLGTNVPEWKWLRQIQWQAKGLRPIPRPAQRVSKAFDVVLSNLPSLFSTLLCDCSLLRFPAD